MRRSIRVMDLFDEGGGGRKKSWDVVLNVCWGLCVLELESEAEFEFDFEAEAEPESSTSSN